MKRNGSYENVSHYKLLERLRHITHDLPGVDVINVAESVAEFVHDGVRTDQLDNFIAMTCSSLIYNHPDYDILATRVAVARLHKVTSPSFVATMRVLADADRVTKSLLAVAERWKTKIEAAIRMERDFDFDYFGFRTLERSYLMSVSPEAPPAERPQYMFMRVALGIHGEDVDAAINTYDLMSTKHFVHATPTLFNAGTNFPQLSSCYLLEVEDDSIEGIFNTMADCAQISKYSGGIGINIHKVRATGAHIASTGGTSTGIVPMLRVFNNIARYVNQGGRRAGSIAVYLEPWHADIEAFIELRRNGGHNEDRCRDLFTALWIPDLFMKRVESDGQWSLMCPHSSPGLSECYGEEFEELYERYEREGHAKKVVRAKDLWASIIQSQIETGISYLLSKESAQRSNHRHLGVIKSSNLCAEIFQYSSPEETAVCNLASICLPTYVRGHGRGATFDFDKLESVVATIVENLNKVIDVNHYPTEKTRYSNLKMRPTGIGIQGLADTFAQMGYGFEDEESYKLDLEIFRSIYYAAVRTSMLLSKKHSTEPPANDYERLLGDTEWPGAHVHFRGSPMQLGRFQFDMWPGADPGTRHDWDQLRKDVQRWGVRNSLLVALMPTASTSQIMGFNEGAEIYNSMLYRRKTLAGEFIVLNKGFARDLIARGLWTPELRERIVLNNGSIQGIKGVPEDLQRIYKSVWDIKQVHVVKHAVTRAPFVCQSQSMNLFVEEPTLEKMTRMHFYSWRAGLKTLSYYCRTRPKMKPQQFTISPEVAAAHTADQAADQEDEAACEMCGS
jgi:ribonucleoside-diphosphate reductase alpha chain